MMLTLQLGPREQLNQATTYLDGSVIYGSSDELMRELRSLQGGQLKTTRTADGRSLLPFNEDPKDGCNQEAESKKGRYCFASGDSRANENIHLTTLHLLLVRQHNLVARQLASLNPTWDDERIFQETRRIVSAQMQHITYYEFLPVLLGRLLMETMNIFPKSTGFYEGYNASVDATVANEFAAAAFRFSHTLLPGLIRMIGNDNSSDEYVELHSMLFNPFELYKIGGMDNTIRGAMSTNTQKVDPYFTNQITQKLFQGHAPCGLDLVTLNIQRGRDHGLPGYPAWRKLCGLSVPKTFGDLKGVIDDSIIQRMSTLYRSVDDIDMYTGALSEFPVKGGFLGPTVACLLSDQFYRLKVGDRFWYENFQEPQAFTPEQLQEIRKTTLAGLICANSDRVTSAQPWVMRTKKPGNYPVPCYGSSIHHPDLTLWEEKEGAFVRPGIGRIKLGPFNSVRAIKLKNSVTPSPNSTEAEDESKRWKEERVRWQEDTAKWMAQVDKFQNHKGQWEHKNSTTMNSPLHSEDISSSDKDIEFWAEGNGFIPVHMSSNIKHILQDPYEDQTHESTSKMYIGRVLSGSVTAVSAMLSPQVWWGGELPMNITRKPLNNTMHKVNDKRSFGFGLLWKAEMKNISGRLILNGTFSIQKYPDETFSAVVWWRGVFTFEVVFNGVFDDNLLQTKHLFSSRIYIHEKHDKSPFFENYPNQTRMDKNLDIKFNEPINDTVNSAKRTPLILLGSFLDNTIFSWNGEFIIVFPTSLTSDII